MLGAPRLAYRRDVVDVDVQPREVVHRRRG
jgi:hypothetical protein